MELLKSWILTEVRNYSSSRVYSPSLEKTLLTSKESAAILMASSRRSKVKLSQTSYYLFIRSSLQTYNTQCLSYTITLQIELEERLVLCVSFNNIYYQNTRMSNYLRQTHQSATIVQIRKKVLSKFISNEPLSNQQGHYHHQAQLDQVQYRRSPLGQRTEDYSIKIDTRIKQLNDINNKIKSTLANTRSKSKHKANIARYENHHLPLTIHTRLKQNRSPPKRAKSPFAEKRHNRALLDPQPKVINFTRQELNLIKHTQSQQIPQDIPQIAPGQKQKMVKLLLEQVKLDVKLRQSKQQYQYNNNPQKRQLLSSAFASRGIELTDSQIDKLLELRPEQYNPFFQASNEQNFKASELVQSFQRAEKHWKQLKESLSLINLEKQGFTIKQMDQSLKGYLSIEDMVCFINMNSQSFLRNRDVYSLMLRLRGSCKEEKGNRVAYETFLKYVVR